MTILLLGANGQVGRELRHALVETSEQTTSRHPGESRNPVSLSLNATSNMDSGLRRNDGKGDPSFARIVAATRDGQLTDGGCCETADLAQPDSLRDLLDRVQPDIIVNAAAHTAVDRAEDEPDLAQRINADAVGVLAQWAAAHDALLVHYSTDYVFDGTQSTPRREDDPTAPLGVYGASKLAGEQALRDSGAHHLLFRTAWVYAAHGHNFLKTMLHLGATHERLTVVDDQHGTPTPAALIAEVTATALRQWQQAEPTARANLEGTFHLVADGDTTWCGFARAIMQRAAASGLIEHAPEVVAVGSSAYPTRAERPTWSVLDTSRLRRTFGIELPRWEQGLQQVLADILRARKS
ncbi:MAG TPA: dTDP-4-dehydrorhamnose reductase [Oleiagrimonas sp.]|nr:dTDP-4-dehydrorhamnose reductase [Oleiagrimonas sp.]